MNTLDARTLACPTPAPRPGGFTLSEGYYLIQELNRGMHGIEKRCGVVRPGCRGYVRDRGAGCEAFPECRTRRGRNVGRRALAPAG